MQIVSDFQNKIKTWMTDMNNYKNNPKNKDKWLDIYQEQLEELEEIYETSMFNENEAKHNFKQMALSNYNNFSAYAYTNDMDTKSIKHNEITKAKMTRTNHKKIKCPQCGREVNQGTSLEEYHCICGYTGEIKFKTNTVHTAADNSKHIMQLLDSVSGTLKVSKIISNILEYVRTWVTNKKYIYEWLMSDKSGKMLTNWIEKYNKFYPETPINETDYFSPDNMLIDPVPANAPKYIEFKLYTDELYNMLETARKISVNSNSNLTGADDETIINVVQSYIDVNKDNPIPTYDTIWEYKNIRYELGHYINYISLIVDTENYPLKTRIEAIIGRSVKMPGLMDNFNKIRNSNCMSLPQRFQYGQRFPFFIHNIFNVIYPNITAVDKQHIIKLILEFNKYYKKENKTAKGKDCNAPLFACVISNIITLPYFHKYRDSIKHLLPEKNPQTVSLISNQWVQFMILNSNLIDPYRTLDPELPILSSLPSLSTLTTAEPSDNEIEEDNPDDDIDDGFLNAKLDVKFKVNPLKTIVYEDEDEELM